MPVASAQSQHSSSDPSPCPFCGGTMIVKSDAQFQRAAETEEAVYFCEKCRIVSKIWSMGETQDGARTSHQDDR